MKPAWKITLVSVVMALLYIGYGWIMHWQLCKFEELFEKLETQPLTITKNILTANRDAMTMSRNARELLLTTDKRHRLSLLSEIEVYENDIFNKIELVRERIESKEGRDLVDSAKSFIETEKHIRERLVQLVFAEQFAAATELVRKEGAKVMFDIQDAMDKIASYAETQGMTYHIESVNSLKQARVILYAGGLIVALLSLVIAMVSGRSMLRGFLASKQAISDADQKTIKLSVSLKTPSDHGVNEAFNALIQHIAAKISLAQTAIAQLALPDEELAKDREASKEFEGNVDRMKHSLEQFDEAQTNIQPIFQQIHRLLRQIRGDLILATQALVSRAVLASDASAKEHANAIREVVDQSAQSLAEVMDVFDPLFKHYSAIVELEHEQITIARELSYLIKPIKNHDARLTELEAGLKKLAKLLSEFSITDDEVQTSDQKQT